MTPSDMPDRTLQQRRDALIAANKIRAARAALKKHLHNTDKVEAIDLVIDILTVPPTAYQTMKVYDLLLAIPRVGSVRVLRFLDKVQCSPSKTLTGVSPRQRAALIAGLRHYQLQVEETTTVGRAA